MPPQSKAGARDSNPAFGADHTERDWNPDWNPAPPRRRLACASSILWFSLHRSAFRAEGTAARPSSHHSAAQLLLNFFETNSVNPVSLPSGVRTIVGHSKLNPSFKRFQYLPHVPAVGRGNRACAAPRATAVATAESLDPAILAAGHNTTLSLEAGGDGMHAGAA